MGAITNKDLRERVQRVDPQVVAARIPAHRQGGRRTRPATTRSSGSCGLTARAPPTSSRTTSGCSTRRVCPARRAKRPARQPGRNWSRTARAATPTSTGPKTKAARSRGAPSSRGAGGGEVAEKVIAELGLDRLRGASGHQVQARSVRTDRNLQKHRSPLGAEQRQEETHRSDVTQARRRAAGQLRDRDVHRARSTRAGQNPHGAQRRLVAVFGAKTNTSKTGGGYPLCTLTFDLAFNEYSKPGFTEGQETTANDYLKEYIVQRPGQEDIVEQLLRSAADRRRCATTSSGQRSSPRARSASSRPIDCGSRALARISGSEARGRASPGPASCFCGKLGRTFEVMFNFVTGIFPRCSHLCSLPVGRMRRMNSKGGKGTEVRITGPENRLGHGWLAIGTHRDLSIAAAFAGSAGAAAFGQIGEAWGKAGSAEGLFHDPGDARASTRATAASTRGEEKDEFDTTGSRSSPPAANSKRRSKSRGSSKKATKKSSSRCTGSRSTRRCTAST